MRVPYVQLRLQYRNLKDEIDAALQKVLDSGIYILGSEVTRFEKSIAAYCDCAYAVGVGNCTDALFLGLKALCIGLGDEVISVPNSFFATTGAIRQAGATPVFVDVQEDYNINPALIEDAITDKTKAIMPVHLTGRPAAMDEILEIVEKYQLALVEDAAQAIGVKYKGRRVGSFGRVAGFSMHPLKTLNASGDGGIITTQDPLIYETVKKLRNHGLKNRDEVEMFGVNSRLDELQAAILNVKLKYLDQWNERCRSIAAFYRKNLHDVVKVPEDKPWEESVYHTFIIQAQQRDALQAFLLQQGIETKVHYPIPIHLQEVLKPLGYKRGDFPVAEKQAEKILSLPIYPELTQEQLELVVSEICNFYERRGMLD